MKASALFAAALLVAPLLAATLVHADDSTVVVEKPWARATPGLSKTGAVYLTLVEHGDADRLIGINTPAAAMAMVHESFVENGVSKMRMLDGVALEPGKTVTMQPGAMHIMLEGLKQPLRVGGTFPLTLTFQKAPPQTVTVTVMKMGAEGPAEGGATKDMPGMKMGD